MKTITRLGFFGAISAAVSSLFAQTTITACAPVLHQMPKPCEGQCPTCGLAHGFVQLSDVEQNQIISTHNWRSLMFACTYCRNLFARTIPVEIWEQYKQTVDAGTPLAMPDFSKTVEVVLARERQ